MDADSALAGFASRVRHVLTSLDAPLLAPFLEGWPAAAIHRPGEGDEAAGTRGGKPLPVLRWMDALAADTASFGASLIADLAHNAHALTWQQTYTARDTSGEFIENYGYAELLGPRAPLHSERIAGGFLLLGPRTLYPRHRHEAEEIYLPLSGTARWQQGSADWTERPPGTIIHHASEEPHAMQTGDRPLLALYLWRSAQLNQKARLVPE